MKSDFSSPQAIESGIRNFKPDYVVVSDRIYNKRNDWKDLSAPVIGYYIQADMAKVFELDGIPSLGHIQNTNQLLEKLVSFAENGSEKVAAQPQKIPDVPQEKTTDIPYQQPAPQRQNAENSNSPMQHYASTADTNDCAAQNFEPKQNFDAFRISHASSEAQNNLRKDLQSQGGARATKTVTVYAAKGGVGKTTIATELAVYLSMMQRGRGNLRVCLVDFNIDFGDVLTTLNLHNNGPTLSHWARAIREQIRAGASPDSIQYSAKEIVEYLQQYRRSSLFVLTAPTAHEESMEIDSAELKVILRNIIENGQFDVVVCDTGNNTRDSTVLALEYADDVMLVATQDVSAVNCDKAFLNTMVKIGFDVNKIRLIVNNILPYKYTQVSVEEVENFFTYPCIARFRRSPDVTKANNCSEPIVSQPNHEFTKEMHRVAAYVIGQNEAPPKKKFFSFLPKIRR